MSPACTAAPACCGVRRALGSRSTERGGTILKLVVLLLLALVIGAIYLLHAPLLTALAEGWIVDDAPQPSDAIILLSPDNFRAERAERCAELFRERWSPRIVASGGYIRPYANLAELMRRDLMERGVPAAAVVAFPGGGRNTREEAYALRKLLREKKWTRVIVVTSNYHTRRARYIWTRAMGREIQVRVVAARDSDFDPRSWWRSREGLKLAFNECIGFLVALVER